MGERIPFHGLLQVQDGCVYLLVLENNSLKKICLLGASGSSSYIGRGDELDEVWSNSSLLLDLVRNAVQGLATIRKFSDLLNGTIFNGEVLVNVLTMTPNVAFQ
jgi:hypothetical protein